ncbi:MAG: aspartyl protease family protein [Campylobacteraceae bacterium]|nr:aspartyl protease family protein [Campylobacteraceae bacterium]
MRKTLVFFLILFLGIVEAISDELSRSLSFEKKLKPVYALMYDAKYHQAELILENMYHNAKNIYEQSFIMTRWNSLLVELQMFDKIKKLLKMNIIKADDESAIMANLYSKNQYPFVSFEKKESTVELQTHFMISLPRVKIKLDGRSFYFVLDTGASINVISQEVADHLTLKTSSFKVKVETATKNSVLGKVGVLKTLKLGPAIFGNQVTLVLPNSDLESNILGINFYQIDGIIGWPILKKLDLVFDFDKDEIIISKPFIKQNKNKNLIWLFEDPMVLTSEKKKHQKLLFLDTGATNSQVTLNYIEKMSLQVNNWKYKKFNGLGGKGEAEKTAEIPEVVFSFPSYVAHLKKVNLRIEHSDCKLNPCDGRIGIDTAKNKRMHIDFSNSFFDISEID